MYRIKSGSTVKWCIIPPRTPVERKPIDPIITYLEHARAGNTILRMNYQNECASVALTSAKLGYAISTDRDLGQASERASERAANLKGLTKHGSTLLPHGAANI